VSPGHDELEVSLLGPGFGESVAIHLGEGDWALIDSCLDSNGNPAGLVYLQSMDVDPAQVVLVVASHWHDDHIGGMAHLVEACPNAAFAYSGALASKEFYALVGALAERSFIRRSGVSEFADVIEVLERRAAGDGGSPSPVMALRDRRLWTRAGSLPASIDAVSPSDAAVHISQQAIASALPQAGSTKRAIPSPKPNHASVVLWVAMGEDRALLGADLEETSRPETGWTAILDDANLHGSAASVFKVPHHGSVTSDQPRVWDEALTSEPMAVLSPFALGRVVLPTDEDRQRIRGYTPNAYLTSDKSRSRRRHEKAVARTLKEMGVSPLVAEPQMGHVRLRKVSSAQDWTFELFGAAAEL
jgi:beta-lactamase superfamily II metal-dependent hydrolase